MTTNSASTRRRRFGRSGVEVTQLGFGAATIGNLFRPVEEATARSMLEWAWDHGVNLYDTAPMYGHGLSERRVGEALRGRRRDAYVLSTKVGRMLRPARPGTFDPDPWVEVPPFAIEFDYSYDAAMRSIDDSLQRIGTDRVEIVFIHDTDAFTHGESVWHERQDEALVGAARALERLRGEGVIAGYGFGVNEWEACHRAAHRADVDCFLLAGRYTLLDQDCLDEFLPLCEQRDISIMLGGGYNSGILATGAVDGAKYNYEPASDAILARVAAIEGVCGDFGVDLPAAALQFPLAHPAVTTIIPGGRTVEQYAQSYDHLAAEIPDEFWLALRERRLVRDDAPLPADATSTS